MADLTITDANVAVEGPATSIRIVQVGEIVTRSQPVYLKVADNKYWLGDCDAEATAGVKGITLSPAAADGYAIIAQAGPIDVGATLSVGEVYVLSDTAGKIMPIGDLTSTQYLTLLGHASAVGVLVLAIDATGTQKG